MRTTRRVLGWTFLLAPLLLLIGMIVFRDRVSDLPLEEGWEVTARADSLHCAGHCDAFAAYRAIYIDTVTGSGSDAAGADLLQHGPVLGIGFTF